jgi:hypothetical protein
MKVKELKDLLQTANPDAELLIRLDGSIYPTSPVEETDDYNHGNDTFSSKEFFIVAEE